MSFRLLVGSRLRRYIPVSIASAQNRFGSPLSIIKESLIVEVTRQLLSETLLPSCMYGDEYSTLIPRWRHQSLKAMLMNSPPPSNRKHATFRPVSFSTALVHSMTTSENLPLLSVYRVQPFLVWSSTMIPAYTFPPSDGGSCGPHRSMWILSSLLMVALIGR